ncbi:MAG: hypothetical protein WCK98_06755 [bacterium]
MSKKLYPILSITFLVLSISLGYVATSGVLSNKNTTSKVSDQSKSILLSSSSEVSNKTSSNNSSQLVSSQASVTAAQSSIPSTSQISSSSQQNPVDDGWVKVEPSNPSSDANQIRG